MKNNSFAHKNRFILNPLAAAVLLTLSGQASALPEFQGKAPEGVSAGFNVYDTYVVKSTNDKQSIDWKSFSIGKNERVEFALPGDKSVVLNRVVGQDPSSILGSLSSNGRIFLINPNGIVFGDLASVSASGFVASTLDAATKDLNGGVPDTLTLEGSAKGAQLLQQGSISANQIALIGASVKNTGSLTDKGTGPAKIYLIAANKVTANTSGDFAVFQVEPGQEDTFLSNIGKINAPDGLITLLAQPDGTGGHSVLNLQGVVNASGLSTTASGKIVLSANEISQNASPGSALSLSGNTEATAEKIDLTKVDNKISGALSLTTPNSANVTTSSVLKVENSHVGGNFVLKSSATEPVALSLNNVKVDQSLNVDSNQGLVQEAGTALQVGKDASLKASSIDLSSTNNEFGGVVSASSNNQAIALGAKGDLVLGDVSGASALNVQAQGKLSQLNKDSIKVTRHVNLTAGSVDLSQGVDHITDALNVRSTSGDLSISRDQGLVLDQVHSAKNLTLRTDGNVLQTPGSSVGADGNSSIQGASIDLSSSTNDFKGQVDAQSNQGGILISTQGDLAVGQIQSAKDLALNASNAITQKSDGGVVAGGNLSLDAGSISLQGQNNAIGGLLDATASAGDLSVKSQKALKLDAIHAKGNLSVQADDALSQTALSRVDVGGTTSLQATSVDLQGAANDFQGAVSVQSTKGDAAITDKNDLNVASASVAGNLNAQATQNLSLSNVTAAGVVAQSGANTTLGNVTTAGNLTVQAAGAVVQVKDTGLNVAGQTHASGTSVDLSNSGNDFQGAVSVQSTKGDAAIADKNDLSLGNVSTPGNLAVKAAGAVSQAKDASLTVAGQTNASGASVDLSNSGNDFQGAVSVQSTRGDAAITDKNDLTVASASVAGNLNAQANQNLSLNNVTATSAATQSGANTTLGNVNTSQNLSVQAAGAVVQAKDASLNVAGQTHTLGSSVDLSNSGNDFKGAVAVQATKGDAAIADKNDLSLGNVSTAGNLTVQAAGTVVQAKDASLTVAGQTNASGSSMDLSNSGNDFQGAVSVQSTKGDAAITDKNDLNVASASVAGNLNAQANQNLSLNNVTAAGVAAQSGANTTLGNVSSAGDLSVQAAGTVVQAKDASLNVAGQTNASGSSVDLSNSGNDFQGAVSVQSTKGDAAITDKNDLTVASASVAGNLNAQANQNLSLSNVTAAGVVAQSGANTTLGNVSTSQNLSVQAAGAVVQVKDSSLNVAGQINASGSSVDLSNSGNDFQGAVAVQSTKGDAAIADKNDLSLGDVSTAGNLTVQAAGALRESTGTSVNVAGQTNASGSSVDLSNSGNDFQGAVSVQSTKGDAAITDKNDLTVASASVAGNLNAQANQNLSLNNVTAAGVAAQSGANTTLGKVSSAGDLSVQAAGTVVQAKDASLNVAGQTNASGSSVNLSNSGNDFKGPLSAKSSSGQILISDDNDLQLGNIQAVGDFNAQAGGTLSDTSTSNFNISGNSQFKAHAIELDHSDNKFFKGGVNVDSNNVSMHASGDLSLTSVPLQNLNVSTSGNLNLVAPKVDQANLVAGAALNLLNFSASGNVSMRGASVRQSGVISVGGSLDVNAGQIDLANSNNDFQGNVRLNGNGKGGVQLNDANDLSLFVSDYSTLNVENPGKLLLGGSQIGTATINAGDLTFTGFAGVNSIHANAESVEQTGGVQFGDATLRAKTVDLNGADNAFQNLVDVQTVGSVKIQSGKNLTVLGGQNDSLNLSANSNLSVSGQQINHLSLSASNVHLNGLSGINSLDLASKGLDQTDAVSVTGQVNLNAANVSLNNPKNDFQGLVTATGNLAGNLQIRDANALSLNASGYQKLTVQSAGDLGLNTAQVSDISLNSGNLDLTNADSSSIQGAVSGNAKINAAKGLSQSGVLDFKGNTDITAGNLILNMTGNNLGKSVAVHSTGNVDLNNASTLSLASLQTAGDVKLVAPSIAQTGDLSVSGNMTLKTDQLTLDHLDNAIAGAVAMDVSGDAVLSAKQLNIGNSNVLGQLRLTGTDGIAQSGQLTVTGNAQIQSSNGDVNLNQSSSLRSGVFLQGNQVTLHNTGDTHLSYLAAQGGTVESDGVLYLDGNVFLGQGALTLKSNAVPTSLSADQLKQILSPDMDVYSSRQAVDPLSGTSALPIASAGVVQTSGVIQSSADSHLFVQASNKASIILEKANHINGTLSALSGERFGGSAYAFNKNSAGVGLTGINNEAPLALAGKGIESDLVAVRSRGLSTQGDAILKARIPYNDYLVGAQASYPGLLLSVPLTSLQASAQARDVYTFGANSSVTNTNGAINVQVGMTQKKGYGGYVTVLPYEGAVVNPDQVIFLKGPSVSPSYRFFYDGAGNPSRIPVSYNGFVALSPQESSALTSSQGSVNLARREQTRSVVRTENVSSRVINGVIDEVGPGRPATEGSGSAAKPQSCTKSSDDSGC